MLDHRVGARIDEPGLAVVELHQVGRRSLVAVHLDDLAVLVRVPDDVAVDADAVASRCLHVRTSSSRAVPTGWATSLGTSQRDATPYPSRRAVLRILPDGPLGSSAMNRISRGYLYAASRSRV